MELLVIGWLLGSAAVFWPPVYFVLTIVFSLLFFYRGVNGLSYPLSRVVLGIVAGAVWCDVLCFGRGSSWSAENFARPHQLDYFFQIVSSMIRELFPTHLQGWLLSIALGDRSCLASSLNRVFQRTGLAHMVVVSGLHIGFLWKLVRGTFGLPLSLAYIIRAITPLQSLVASVVLDVMVFLLMINYGLLIGLPSPVLRVLILFGSQIFFRWLVFEPQTFRRLSFSILIHSLFFPLSFWSSSSFLSWGAYTIIRSSNHTFSEKWLAFVFQQFYISAFMALFFNQFSFEAVLFNLVFGSLFPFVFVISISGLILLLVGQRVPILIEVVTVINTWFLDSMVAVASYFEGPLSMDTSSAGDWLRVSLIIVLMAMSIVALYGGCRGRGVLGRENDPGH